MLLILGCNEDMQEEQDIFCEQCRSSWRCSVVVSWNIEVLNTPDV